MRNWIEEKLGKRIAWSPCWIGWKAGRKIYSITFEDMTEGDYFIDFDNKEIESI